MALGKTFGSMLNEYLTYDLLKDAVIDRDYLLKKVAKDNSWKGGTLIVPFRGATASSLSFGSLTASNDIAEAAYVRGEISSYKSAHFTLLFNHLDLIEHDGRISESSFLKILPEVVEDGTKCFKESLSINMLNGAHFAVLTADSTANDGLITVDRPERFIIGQKVQVDDDDTADATGYVSTINLDTKVVLLVTARGGATPVDFSAAPMTVAQNAKVYYDNAKSNSFTSLRSQMLSLANGGSTNLFGQAKTAYPYLQCIQYSGATMSATNVLTHIFDAFTEGRKFGGGNPATVLMSFKHLGSVMKQLEDSKGLYNVVPQSEKHNVYGWTQIDIFGVKGKLTVVGIQEMDDDWMALIDWDSMKLHSNGFFRKRKAPDGREYFELRATTGYQYIVDLEFYGELALNKPRHNVVIHSIPNYT